MTRREIKSVISKAEKVQAKILKLSAEAAVLREKAQKSLDNLAKDSCPFQKGQIFKKRGSVIWAKMTNVSAAQMHHGRIDEKYPTAPFLVDCLRCSAKGETQKGKHIFIRGHEIGVVWDPVE